MQVAEEASMQLKWVMRICSDGKHNVVRKLMLCAGLLFGFARCSSAVELVNDGKPVADIVLSDAATPSVKTAGQELQRYLEAMSGAKLPIVSQPSSNFANHVYVGESEYTRRLGITIADIQYDGFKIVAKDHDVILVGREMYHYATHFTRFKGVARNARQKTWEEFCGHKWRSPSFWEEWDYNQELGFYALDGTGTLYAMYDLLEQLGMRWYMPGEALGIVIPKLNDIRIADQNLKKEPQFPQRIMVDPQRTRKDDFLWYKSMRVGVAFVMPCYHSVGRPMALSPEQQPQEYYGVVNGKIDYTSPRLTSERLRKDVLEYLEWADKAYPGIQYASLGQPDGWSTIDSRGAAAGWDKTADRGPLGGFSDYVWDFNLDIRKRYMQKCPDKKFTMFAYSGTNRRPKNIEKIPDNVVVFLSQTSPQWMVGRYKQDREFRDEWLKMLGAGAKDQLMIDEQYLEHAPMRNFPPVPDLHEIHAGEFQ
jgi:hypothetical protein